MPTVLPAASLEKVEDGLVRLHRELRVDSAGSSTRIAPLADALAKLNGSRAFLRGGLELVISEVPNLSFRTAADHLKAETGLLLPDLPDPERRRDGLLVAWMEGELLFAYILVSAGGLVERRRFSAAHELGHLVLHVLLPASRGEQPVLFVEGFAQEEEQPPPDDERGEWEAAEAAPAPAIEVHFGDGATPPLPPLDVLEAEADAFAAHFLMPAGACRALAESLAPTFGDRRATLARRMAPEFLVSKTAMLRRLENLGLGTEPTR